MNAETLRPTEDLCMEVLAARARLGETLWTFDSRHRRALDTLAERGLVDVMHGIVERTVRASLTDKGRRACLSDGYVPPLLKTAVSETEHAAESGLARLLADKVFQEALLATAGHMETQWISPECRANRTVDGAWDEAVRRLRQIYDAQVKHDPTITLGLSIGRQTASVIPSAKDDA